MMLSAACAGSPGYSQSDVSENMTDSPRLTLERLFASPSLSGPSPRGVKFSPDGKRVTFLKGREEDASRFDLWQFDVATGEQSLLVDSKILEPEEVELSEEEKALRERKRISGQRGIVSYDWGTADTILVPIGGDLHLVTLKPEQGKITLQVDSDRLEEVLRVLNDLNQALAEDDLENVQIELENGERVNVIDLPEYKSLKTQLSQPEAKQLTDTEAFEYDAKVSPLGNYVSFVRDGAVVVIELATGKETQITPDAEPDKAISYGVAEFVAQEEMSRYTGYWWSPDERYVAYTKVDESTVDVIERFDIAADKTTVIDQRYPRAGRPNAIVDLFVRDMASGEATEVTWRREDWGPATDQYLARVGFNGPSLEAQLVDRDQKQLMTSASVNLSLFDASGSIPKEISLSGKRVETQPHWVNLSDDISASQFYTSEESGFRHIKSLVKGGFQLPSPPENVTTGDWVVSDIVYSGDRILYFTGFKDSPLEKHLYRIDWTEDFWSFEHRLSHDPTASLKDIPAWPDPIRITEPGKSWSVTMSPDGKTFVGTSSSPDQPPQTGLYRVPHVFTDEELKQIGAERLPDSNCIDLTPRHKQVKRDCPETKLIAWIEENKLDESHPYFPYLANHTVPTYGTLEAEDGQTLYYSYQTPPDFDPTKQYPVIVEVYGGPHVQTVNRNWERMTDQFFAHEGYIVFRLDNRGSYNRGKRFEDVIYHQTGGPEVRDQLLGVDWLKSQPFVDPDRIAIQGWSYGGYMTLMVMLQAEPDTFAAAASGAPVTDWSLYDTFYTERYMGTPQNNPDGYEKSSVFYHLDRWQGDLPPLLLMHGMADDNVTFDNTTRLMAAMQERGLIFDLMTYPGQRHGIRGQALSTHLMKTRMRFLDRYLKPGE